MNSRYLRIIASTIGLFLGGLLSAAEKPNIIYILTDDLGYGDLSCYGQKKFKTPHIDRIAAEGMQFSDHYSGSTVCAPSRCSLLTGLHTGHAQVRGNKEVQPEGQAPMLAGTVTIPMMLRKAGYVTGAFGKWGLGSPGSVSDPMEHFDTFYGYNCQRAAHSFTPSHLWHDRKKVMLDGQTYSHDLILNEALDFIKAKKEEPFFVYLAISIPHAAMQAPKELHDKYRKLYPQFEHTTSKYGGVVVKNPVAGFPAMMEHLDNGIGVLLDTLKKLEIDDNTLVMFTSDNGAHREGGHNPDFWDSNGPLRGIKRDMYDGGIRTPLLVRWPAKIKAGSMSDHISAFWDMMPTFCEVAGVDETPETDGISMLPTLLGKEQKKHKYLYWEIHSRAAKQAIRKGKWKAVRIAPNGKPLPATELYDVTSDIGEKNNVAAGHPEIVSEMEKLFKSARVENPNFPLFKNVGQKKRQPQKKKAAGVSQ